MAITIRNAHTKEEYGTSPSLSTARSFCSQRLLQVGKDRQGFLSDLAAGIIEVYDARAVNYTGPGF